MSAPTDKPPVPKPSASIIIVRDGPLRANGKRLEVLMTERHGAMRVAGGAFVFPGGKVEPQDRNAAVRRRFPGLSDTEYRVSAIREAFEEAGVLLARPAAGKRYQGRPPMSRAVQAAILADHRRHGRRPDFLDHLAKLDLVPAAEALAPFARWITPVIRRWRFDARFYLAAMPKAQDVVHDGGEAVSAFWARPEEMVEKYGNDITLLMFPTRTSLRLLSKAATVSDALALARRRPVVPITPKLEERADGIWAHVPAAADLGGTVLPFSLKKVPQEA